MNFLFACDQPALERRVEYTLFGFPLSLDGNRYPLVTIAQSEDEGPIGWRGLLAAFRLHGIFIRERGGRLTEDTLVVESNGARELVRTEGSYLRAVESACAT